MQRSAFLLLALAAVSGRVAATEWLDGTVLADCEHCRSKAFAVERKAIANQLQAELDPASAMGYVVTVDGGGRFVWGRAALVGTGNLIRTDAHVLFADTGVFKARDGKIYFEPMHHGGDRDLIEIDRSSVQRGGALSALEPDLKDDWAIARLREDAVEKFDGEDVFALLWDVELTQDEIVKREVRHAAAIVPSAERRLDLAHSCESVVDDHPSRHSFGVDEIFFIRCPPEDLQSGASGSAVAILARDGAWHLGGQLIAGGTARAAAGEGTGESGPAGPQLFLGNVPNFRQTMATAYLRELIRRGLDPRGR